VSAVPTDRQEEGLFVVLREYTHTDRKKLYKVLSRPMSDERTAISWMDFMASVDEPSPGNKFMVVKVVAEVMGDKPPRKKKG
jgi:hypothetical protein